MEETLEADYDINPTPLYEAICNGEWESAISLANSDPIQCKTWVIRYDQEDKSQVLWRFLPLHSACARQPPDTLIETLLAAYPKAAFDADDQGFLPLHYACGNRASDAVVSMLLVIHPQAAMVTDPYGGKLPLHHVSQWGAYSAGVVNMVISVFPEAIHVKDVAGLTPLDLAKSANYAGRSVVMGALKRCSVASKFRLDADNRLKADAMAEEETIQEQKNSIVSLKAEVETYRSEVDSLSRELKETRGKCQADLDSERSKKQELENTLLDLQTELKSLKDVHSAVEKEYSNALVDIDSNKYEILNLRQEKIKLSKETDTLAEKLALKTKNNEETICRLQESLDETRGQLETRQENNEKLSSVVKTLEYEVKSLVKDNEKLQEEIKELEHQKSVALKIDELETYMQKVISKFSDISKQTEQSQAGFQESVVERERKILEIAQLEEKLRASTMEEQDNLRKELDEQQEEMQKILKLIKS